MAYIPNGGVGTPDSNMYFCTAQSIPTDGADDISENVIDLVYATPNFRGMEKAKLKVEVTTLIAVASGTSSKMNFNLVTASTAALCTVAATEIMKGVLRLGYNDAAGKVYEAGIPLKGNVAYQRFIGLVLEPVSDDTLYSAGAIDAWLEF
ncbi:MAG: hypothetical protein ABIJ57_01260 [Pseudomonadota bacterium]